jgi:hypothetical protein
MDTERSLHHNFPVHISRRVVESRDEESEKERLLIPSTIYKFNAVQSQNNSVFGRSMQELIVIYNWILQIYTY